MKHIEKGEKKYHEGEEGGKELFQKMELVLEDIRASGTKSDWQRQSCGLYLGCRQAEQRPVCSLVL